MRTKISLETVICLALIFLGIGAYLTIGWGESSASPFLLRQERAMGALDYQSMPKIYAIALVLFCAINILFQFTKRSIEQRAAEQAALDAEAKDLIHEQIIRFRTVATIVVSAAYALLLPYVFFFPATVIFLFVMFWVYGQRNLKITLPISLVGAFCLWGLFIKLAGLPLGKI